MSSEDESFGEKSCDSEEEEGEKEKKIQEVNEKYVEETKKKLLLIFKHLEKDEYMEAIEASSCLISDVSLEPLINKLKHEKKELLDVITEIMKKSGRYIYFSPKKSTKIPDPSTFFYNTLKDFEERTWYRSCFRDDCRYLDAPQSDFEPFFELLKKYENLGRKKFIQMYFFGEYFGVNEVTDEQITREGLGVAIERGRKFYISWKFICNKPSKKHGFLYYDTKELTFIDPQQHKFTVKYLKKDQKKDDNNIVLKFSTEDNTTSWGIKDMYSYKSSASFIGDGSKVSSIRKSYSGDDDDDFPSLDMLDEESYDCYAYHNDVESGYGSQFREDEEEDIIITTKKADNNNNDYDFDPSKPIFVNRILHFFPIHKKSSLGSFIDYLIEKRQMTTLKSIFSKFPKNIVDNRLNGGYHSESTSPLFFSILNSRDEELIYHFITGFGDASKLLLDSLKEMKYMWWGEGSSHDRPVVHKIYSVFSTKMKKKGDIRVDKTEIDVNEKEFDEIRHACGDKVFWQGYTEEEEKGKKTHFSSTEEFEEKKRMYIELKKKKYETIHEKEVRRREKYNKIMKRLFRKLLHYLDWNSSETWGFKRSASKSDLFMEILIKHDNLPLAKFLIEDLMVEKIGEEEPPIKNKLNYFKLDDIKLSGNSKIFESYEGRKKRRSRRRILKKKKVEEEEEEEEENVNETYKYVKSKRTFWNPTNFKYFSREYQHIVCLFTWCLDQKEWFLPPEMICWIFQFVGYFDFPYILGKTTKESGTYVWEDPLPSFSDINVKLYFHEILKIKTLATQIFEEKRHGHGLMEFKGMLEFCLASANKFFSYITKEEEEDFLETDLSESDEEEELNEEEEEDQKGVQDGLENEKERKTTKTNNKKERRTKIEDMDRERYFFRGNQDCRHQHDLILFVHHLKQEIRYRIDIKKQRMDRFVDVLVHVVHEAKKRQVQKVKDRIQYEREHRGASRWRRPNGQTDWVNVTSDWKYYSVPGKLSKNYPSLRECVVMFLEVVKGLK